MPLKEQAPANAIGSSSSVHGTGSVDTTDLPIKKKPVRRRAKSLIAAVRVAKGLEPIEQRLSGPFRSSSRRARVVLDLVKEERYK